MIFWHWNIIFVLQNQYETLILWHWISSFAINAIQDVDICHRISSFNIIPILNVDIWWASRPRTPINRLRNEKTHQKEVCDGYETRICMVSAPKTDSNLRNRCRPTYVQHLFFIVKTIWKLIFGWPTSKFCYKTNMRRWHFDIELQALL